MFFLGRVKRHAKDSPLWGWWLRLLPRERLIVLVLMVVILLLVLNYSVWQPVARYVGEAKGYFESQRLLNEYLDQNSQRLRVASVRGHDQLTREQLQSAVTSGAQRYGLQVERLDRDDESLLVVVVGVEFKGLIMWLDGLQGIGCRVSDMTVSRVSSGKVEARVRLRSAG